MKRLVLYVALSALSAVATAQSQPRGTLWLGTSLMYETDWSPPQTYTWAFGLAAVVVDRDTGDDEGRIGPAVEAIFYQDRQPRGLAFVVRGGLVDGGIYAAPGVYYVSRPRDSKMLSFRAGALVPLGGIGDGSIVPATLELAVGIRF